MTTPTEAAVMRTVMLLAEPEVEVTAEERNQAFSDHCTNTKIVKRKITGPLAQEIVKRVGSLEKDVFISELEATMETSKDHFDELVVSVGSHKFDFGTYNGGGNKDENFTALLTWVKQ